MATSRRDFLKVAGGAGIATIAAACAPGTTTTTTPTTPGGGTTAAPVAIKRGGTINIAAVGLQDLQSWTVFQGNVYEPLFYFRGESYNDMTFIPRLAQKWTLSADARTLTLNLRPNVKWQNLPPVNGRPFTAADVAWTATFYQKHSTTTSGIWDNVASVETPDPLTAILRLKEADVSILAALANRESVIVPKEIFDRDGSYAKAAVGTGPFMVKEFVPMNRMIWVKNPDYWEMGEDGKPLPYLDGINLPLQADYAARLAGIRAGQFHMDVGSGTILASEAADLKALGFTIFEGAAVLTRDLHLQPNHPAFKDLRVRQAASLAIDRDGWIRTQYDNAGTYQSFVPIPGWTWDEATLKTKFKQDIEKGKQLLTAAGFAGTKIKVTTLSASNSGLSQAGAEFIAADLRKVGFVVEFDLYPANPQLVNTAVNPGKWDVMIYTHGSNGVDPMDYLRVLQSSVPPSGGNYGGYKDPKLDDMIKAQLREPDEVKRKTIVRQIEDHLYDTMLFAPIAQPRIFKPRSPKIKGPNNFHATITYVNLRKIWLDG